MAKVEGKVDHILQSYRVLSVLILSLDVVLKLSAIFLSVFFSHLFQFLLSLFCVVALVCNLSALNLFVYFVEKVHEPSSEFEKLVVVAVAAHFQSE